MDEDFPTEPLKTPCMSDTVTSVDFSQLQTTATSSADYDLQVFSPSFDNPGSNFPNPETSLKAGSNVSSQHDSKGFLDDNMMDLQLYESLQNHHNYSLKPAESVTSLAQKQETGGVGDFTVVSSLAGHLSHTHGGLQSTADSDDHCMDISDPLKEICGGSSPLYVHSQSKESGADRTHSVYTNIIDSNNKENGGKEIDQPSVDEAEAVKMIYGSLPDLHIEKHKLESPKTENRNISETDREMQVAAADSGTNTAESLEAIEDKTMFSENLGLIPADNGMKSLEKKPTVRKGVRTRKSYEKAALGDTSETIPVKGHRHFPGVYRCGSCSKTFATICKLHQHLLDHSSGGSYHYNHMLKTAFPKFDTVCAYTQTAEKGIRQTPKDKTFGKGIKLKSTTSNKSIAIEEPVVKKRKRGRPRKVELEESEEHHMETEESKKVINKLKVKTRDGGNTWKEVKKEPSPVEESFLIVNEVDEVPLLGKEDFEVETSKNDYVYQLEGNIDISTEKQGETSTVDTKEGEPPEKKSRKRKMSIPRKISKTSGSDSEKKIINSRSKPVFKIKCDFCDCEFQYTRGLIRHEQEKHAEEMKFDCDICDQKFMRAYNLERHKLCAHTTGKSRLLRQRKGISVWKEKKKRGRKPLERSPVTYITCEVCGKSLPESKVEIHLRIHSGERPFICHVCGKGLISDKKLKRHLLIHSETKRHTCEVCGQGFAMKNKLRTHMFIHTGHKPYLCSVCGAEFNNSTSLLHHHRTVHLGDKRFECEVCGGRYGKKSQLEEHMFSHSTERTQTCKFCGKSFKHGKSLRRHELTHVSDQKFSCDQCDSKFSRKDNLERHKMCHIETSLCCRFCKKKFRDQKPLLDHEEFHINQRRYQCLVCKDKFQEETYFYSHMEKTHELTRKTVEAMIANRDMKENKDTSCKELLSHGIMMDSPGDQLDQPGTITIVQDTLNFSMNLAGIIPTSGQELVSGTTSVPLSGGSSVLNQALDSGQNIIITNGTHQIIAQPGNAGFAAAARVIPGVADGQRAAFGAISTTDGGGLRLPINQQAATIALTSDNIIEQQRLMQEALGSSLNIQNTGFRMQNLY